MDINRNYIRFYWKQNKKYILLLLTVMAIFMLLPLLTKTQLPYDQNMNYQYFMMKNKFLVFVCMLMFFVPLYNFAFLMKRASSDFYFSVGMKRKTFFYLQYATGAAVVIIPTLSIYIVSVIYILVMLPVDLRFLNIIAIAIGVECIALACYTLMVMLIVLCNHIIDAILVCTSYLLIPFFVKLMIGIMTANYMQVFLVSNDFSATEITLGDQILSYVSPPVSMASLANALNPEVITEVSYHSIVIWGMLAFYALLGLVCFFLARFFFQNRKSEDSQQRTKHFLTYPLLIIIITFSLLLNINLGAGEYSLLIVVFSFFLLLNFVAYHAIAIHRTMLYQFFAIMLVGIGLVFSFQQTQGFGYIYEIPAREKIQKITLVMQFDLPREYQFASPIFPIPNVVKTDHIYQDEMRGSSIDKLLEFHDEILTSHQQDGIEEYSEASTIRLYYYLEDGTSIHRTYAIHGVEEQAMCDDLINTLIKDGALDTLVM